jgi:penicillin-insensitive murein endopeptidase
LSNGGNGCDDTLMWWVTDYLSPPKSDGTKKPKEDDAPKKKGPRQMTMADLPRQCRDVLDSP